MSYDPNSTDSMFSKIIERLDKQDGALARIEAQTTKTNGRVGRLENEQWRQRGVVAAVSVMGVAIWEWFSRHW
jgi:hypothetical protein